MPRIKAATVPEHREAQREALLKAARAVVVEQGVTRLTFTDLADRAGVARPSVYDYFATKTDLVLALVDAELPAWRDEIRSALDGAGSPGARVEAFIRTQLRLVADGRHALPFALARSELDPKIQVRVAKIHEDIARLLHEAVAELGVSDVPTGLALTMGAVRTAIELLSSGRPEPVTADAAVAFVAAGLAALRSAKGASEAPRGSRRGPPRAKPRIK